MYGREGAYILFDIGPENAVNLFKIFVADNYGRLFLRIIVLSYGAAIGDLIGSWFKRRLNRTRGQPIWLVDQLDFVIVCLLLSMFFVPLDIYFWNSVIFLLILSPSLTIFANMISYVLRLKSVPW
jgi:CDP-2,3-bis-(O-geranylgeranyl)-sn-glycerol synthase